MSQCEFEFLFPRCEEEAVSRVVYGQDGGWTYNYCAEHRDMVISMPVFAPAYEIGYEPS